MRVGTKLISGFTLVAVMGAVVASIGILGMSRLNHEADAMYREDLVGLSYIKEANINLVYAGRARASFLAARSEEERARLRGDVRQALDAMDGYLAKA